jgi:hypothetical protein
MFAFFESALKLLHSQGQKKYGNDWTVRLAVRRQKMEAAYAGLHEQDRDQIPYRSLSARAAYLFGYAAPRAEYTKQFLLRHRAKFGGPLFTKKTLRVVSFGGGPASELVGLIGYLEDCSANEPVENLEYIVYDKDGEWETTASLVMSDLVTPIKIKENYKALDVIDSTKMAKIDLANIDLVMFSYIMSELSRLEQKDVIIENFRRLLGTLSVGSKILFIDSLHPIFIQFFQSCKLVPGLRQKNDNGDPINFGLPKLPPTFGELKKKLDWVPRTELRAVSKLIVRQ